MHALSVRKRTCFWTVSLTQSPRSNEHRAGVDSTSKAAMFEGLVRGSEWLVHLQDVHLHGRLPHIPPVVIARVDFRGAARLALSRLSSEIVFCIPCLSGTGIPPLKN